MTWEEKVEMIQLSNQADNKKSRRKFLEYVIKHIEKFDEQAYDMFITGLSLIPEEIIEDIEYHKKIIPYIENKLKNGNGQGLRTSFRLALYITIYESNLNIKDEK